MRSIGNVQKDAQVRAVASGALSNGDTVVVNSDGTVSAVAADGNPESIGTAVVFETGSTAYSSCAYDAANNKIVIAYRDAGDSDKGKAVVGTVSGTSITFGTPVVFASGGAAFSVAIYEPVAEKVVIFYADNGNSSYGTGIVGTVSGTSISFGTATVFNSGTSFWNSAAYDANAQKIVVSTSDYTNSRGSSFVAEVSGTSISFSVRYEFTANTIAFYTSTVYDSVNQKIVVTFRDSANSNYGAAIVGTVSGDVINFGTSVVFNAASTEWTSAVYDSAQGKIVIAYTDAGNSSYGTAIVGTVSGTSISFGSETVFETSSSNHITASYNASAGKTVIAYRDTGNSNYGTFVAATVSGTSVSFSSPTILNYAHTYYFGSTYDSTAKKTIISYGNLGSSGRGEALVYSPESTNLTSDNFIGFADGAYADTQSAAINTTCSVDRNQTSLTAGQKYYVQTDGSLGTTAADPSVEAGTAISSTEILVKG